MLSYGSSKQLDSGDILDMKISIATGAKAFWFSPRDDLSAYSIKNISFPNPKGNIDFKVVGGEWIFNQTTLRDSNLTNTGLSTKKTMKFTEKDTYRHPFESSNMSLLNCVYNESKLSVDTDMAEIRSKYYAQVSVKDEAGNPIQGATINITASNPKYYAESLYQYENYTNDGYGPGLGPGEGGSADGGADQYETYSGGSYFRWWDSLELGNTTTGATGKTDLPTGNLSNSIVLTDKVWIQGSNSSLTYYAKVSAPSYSTEYVTIDPNSTWYTANESQPQQINVTMYESGDNAPIANFYSNASSGGRIIAFTDTSRFSPTSWSWNFGDEATSTEQNPIHNYSQAGTYTVTLTATNAIGSNETTQTITVTGAQSTFNTIAQSIGTYFSELFNTFYRFFFQLPRSLCFR
jgi:hypothetical protein